MRLPLRQIRAIAAKSVGQVRRLVKNPRAEYSSLGAITRTAQKKLPKGISKRAQELLKTFEKNPDAIPLNPNVLHHIAEENAIDVTNELTAKGLIKALKRKQYSRGQLLDHPDYTKSIERIGAQRDAREAMQHGLRRKLARKVVRRTAIGSGGAVLAGGGYALSRTRDKRDIKKVRRAAYYGP